LDVLMPVLDGPRTLDILREHNPDIRCCFATAGTSGYTDDDLYSRGAVYILRKPFSAAQIGQVLRNLVSSQPRQLRSSPA
jgi:CheY-like chemotaxis protein